VRWAFLFLSLLDFLLGVRFLKVGIDRFRIFSDQTCTANCTVLQASYWCDSQGNDCSTINPSCVGTNPNCVGISPTNKESFSNGEFSFYFPSGAPSSISLTERCSGVPITAGQTVICNALEMLLQSSGCPVIFPNGQVSCNFPANLDSISETGGNSYDLFTLTYQFNGTGCVSSVPATQCYPNPTVVSYLIISSGSS